MDNFWIKMAVLILCVLCGEKLLRSMQFRHGSLRHKAGLSTAKWIKLKVLMFLAFALGVGFSLYAPGARAEVRIEKGFPKSGLVTDYLKNSWCEPHGSVASGTGDVELVSCNGKKRVSFLFRYL